MQKKFRKRIWGLRMDNLSKTLPTSSFHDNDGRSKVETIRKKTKIFLGLKVRLITAYLHF